MKLLLVDTSQDVASTLRDGLRTQGYNIDAVSTGEMALQNIHTENYVAVILELQLPDMDGGDVCQELRDKGYAQPVLMLTAEKTLARKIDCFRAGADDFITKPFSMDEFAARLSAAVRRADITGKPGTLSHEALVLDCNSCEVTWKTTPIELTPREFTLLKCLMEHNGGVLSSGHILEQAWRQQADPLTNIVAVYIRRLREKLKQAGAPPFITTVRGFGYRFGQAEGSH